MFSRHAYASAGATTFGVKRKLTHEDRCQHKTLAASAPGLLGWLQLSEYDDGFLIAGGSTHDGHIDSEWKEKRPKAPGGGEKKLKGA